MSVRKISVFILLFVILLVGCAPKIITYSPKTSPVKPGMIPEYSFNQSIKVANGQSPEVIQVKKNDFHITEMNLREMTDVAVELTKEELTKKGFQIQDNADKVLEIIIEDVTYSMVFRGMPVAQCNMIFKVKPGNEDYRTYQPYNSGGWPSSCDFAITKAVSGMLSDQHIIDYLKKD